MPAMRGEWTGQIVEKDARSKGGAPPAVLSLRGFGKRMPFFDEMLAALTPPHLTPVSFWRKGKAFAL